MIRRVLTTLLAAASVFLGTVWIASFSYVLSGTVEHQYRYLDFRISDGRVACVYVAADPPEPFAWAPGARSLAMFAKINTNVELDLLSIRARPAICFESLPRGGVDLQNIGALIGFPLWSMFALTAAVPLILLTRSIRNRIRRWRWRRRGRCPSCGYNRAGNTSGVCPQCAGRWRADPCPEDEHTESPTGLARRRPTTRSERMTPRVLTTLLAAASVFLGTAWIASFSYVLSGVLEHQYRYLEFRISEGRVACVCVAVDPAGPFAWASGARSLAMIARINTNVELDLLSSGSTPAVYFESLPRGGVDPKHIGALIGLPLWSMLALTTAVPLMILTRSIRNGMRRWRWRRRGRCPACGYDLTGNTSGVCPECAAEIDTDATAAREESPT